MSRTRTKWLALSVAVAATLAGLAGPALADDSPGAVAGQLTDNGAPVAEAYVMVVDANYDYFGSAVTDASGAYHVPDIPAGTYKVRFEIGGGLVQWATQKSHFEVADPITVTAGETTTVNESVLPHGTLTGHVFNSDGTPAPYAYVSAAGDGPESGYASTSTDADGLYVMPYLSPGNYRVAFQSAGSSLQQYAHNTGSYEEATLISVLANDTTTLDQTFVSLGAITGQVTKGGIPVEGVEVSAQENGPPHGYGSAVTGPDGTYRIELWPGEYTLAFRHNGLTQYAYRELNPLKATTFAVAVGADTVVNERIRATGTVSGQLTTAAGDPVVGAMVELVNQWNQVNTSTDENGMYQVTTYAGTYQLAFNTGYGKQWSSGASSAATASDIAVLANQNVTVNESLKAPGVLTVTAEDAITHAPVAEFCVDLDFTYQCTSSGSVTVDPILPGRHAVRYWGQQGQPYLPANLTSVITSGQTTSVTLALEPGATVSTVMRDAKTGDPVANACLELVEVTRPQTLGIGSQTCSDASGQVALPGVRPGAYKTFVWARDAVHGHQWLGPDGGVGKFKRAITVTVAAGQDLVLPDVALDKAGTITGTVTDQVNGTPIANASVMLSTFLFGYGDGQERALTDNAGQYSYGGLGPYAWTLYFYKDGYASEWSGDSATRDKAVGIRVRRGQTTTYDTALDTGTVITGKIVGSDGTRASDGRVIFINATSGDEIAVGDVYYNIRRYTAHVKGVQHVKIKYDATVHGQGYSGWAGGADFATATSYRVGVGGEKRLTVTVTQLNP